MSNKAIAKTLKFAADLMEIKGENGFKIGSYLKAARAIETLGVPVEEYARKGLLGEIQGIGTTTKQVVKDILETGTFPELDKLLQEIPQGIQKMLTIKGIGPKKIQFFWMNKGWETIEDLYYACVENRLAEEKGFGLKTQQSIKDAIEFMQNNEGKFHYGRIYPFAMEMLKALKAQFPQTRISFCGAILQKSEIVESVEFIVENAPSLQNHLVQFLTESLEIEAVKQSPQHFICIVAQSRFCLEVHFSDNFNQDLFLLSTPAEHLQDLGINAENCPKIETESQLYTQLGYAYVAPELREVPNVLQKNTTNLVQSTNIKGVVHTHSTYSDGANTLKDMAIACQELGYEYLVISDHSKSAFYANGLSEGRIEEQHREIAQLNLQLKGFRIFKSIESDILYDGQLDYDEEVLKSFDCIIASIHSILKMDKAKATQRLLTAIEHPKTHILGHPTGRLLLMRAGYPIDYERILDACAHHRVAIEINANPYRLDLDWRWVEYAWKKGILISINPDAHSIAGIADIQWGINTAQKGLLPIEMCLNAKNQTEFAEWCAAK